ncbi:iron chelate uptake ABC transporter family permease subunit [Klebsiella pneumoniae]
MARPKTAQPNHSLRKVAAVVATAVSGMSVYAQAAEQPKQEETITVVATPVAQESAWGPAPTIAAKRSATATKTDTPIEKTPQSVSVVTRQEMEMRQPTTVKEALSYTPSVFSTRGSSTTYDVVTIRGFTTSTTVNTNQYLDGMKLQGNNYSEVSMDPYFLERVEVMRGPTSVLYGNSNPGGIVSMVSKRPTTEPLKEVQFKMGTDNLWQTGFDFSDAIDDAGVWSYRLTGNPMASPEVLGISSGAAFGVVLMLFFVPGDAFGWLLPAGSLGAAATLLIIMLAAGRGGFSPHRMLLAGMALSTAFTMLLMMLQASGDPRMAQILTWISGSTYSATPERVVRSGAVMLALLALAPLCRRWLTILPLGGEAARAVGMALTSSRIVLLLLAACLTAAATLTIGPLSFVGLMAPHIARMMGFRRTLPHMVISGLTGGLLLVFADWCGRMMMFPYQIPAGLLSTFIGAPYFIYLLRKQSR